MAICFLQSDPRWEKYPFSGGHMDFDGCGPTACADFIYEINSNILPTDVADYMTSNGHVCEGSGVYWKSIAPTLEHYGIKCTMMNQFSVYEEKDTDVEVQWLNLMKTGKYYGILLVGHGDFTIGTGHFISAISLSDDNQVLIYNPGLSNGKTGIYPWSMIQGQVKVFYIIEKPKLDVLFTNVEIIDGTGAKPRIGCAGIINGNIILDGVSENQDANKVVDGLLENGEHLILFPGFIDSHSHVDEALCENPEKYLYAKINQGITTEICGMCGESMFPINPANMDAHLDCLSACVDEYSLKRIEDFTDFDKFLEFVESIPKGQNYAFNIGHGTLRSAVMGTANRKPSEDEFQEMEKLLVDAMEKGCIGLSTGLVYNPGVYADKEEIIRLCKIIAPYGGIYSSHIRNESDKIVEAVEEAIDIAYAAGVKLVISHHKICGHDNFGLSKETLKLISDARNRGQEVYIDQYPYEATQTNANSVLPPKYFSLGLDEICNRLQNPEFRRIVEAEITDPNCDYDNPWKNSRGFDNILTLTSPNEPEAIGKTVGEYAAILGKEPFETYFDLLVKNKGLGMSAYMSIGEEDMNAIYLDQGTVVGSDCIIMFDDTPVHPRTYGALVRSICRFHKEKGIVPLEVAIRKQTGLTADIWGIENRGYIKHNYKADLLVIDYGKLKDNANYYNGGKELCDGIEQIYVNGQLVYKEKGLTGVYSGEILVK